MSPEEIKNALNNGHILTDGHYYAEKVGKEFFVWTYISYIYEDIETFLDEILKSHTYGAWEIAE